MSACRPLLQYHTSTPDPGVSYILAGILTFRDEESLGSASKWSYVSRMGHIDSAWNSWWELRADADMVGGREVRTRVL
jgi:hypothetical protein